MLRKYECLHLFPVPSTMSAAMRKPLYSSGAKDDPRDADLLLDLPMQHRDRLRHLQPDDEETRRVQNLVDERRKLVDEKTAQIPRLIGADEVQKHGGDRTGGGDQWEEEIGAFPLALCQACAGSTRQLGL